jgi:hypothetical protein
MEEYSKSMESLHQVADVASCPNRILNAFRSEPEERQFFQVLDWREHNFPFEASRLSRTPMILVTSIG